MLSSTWIISSFALFAVATFAAKPEAKAEKPAATAASADKAEVKDTPAAAYYGGGPSFSSPQYPVFQFPNFDVNYCSVHASFPLVGFRNRHHGHHGGKGDRDKRQTYGVSNNPPASNTNYGPTFDAPSYGPSYIQRPRPFKRYGCRNSAIYNRDSCQNCCAIASRASGNTAPVVGILMIFDPKLSAKHHKKDNDANSSSRALQCVCCTSRRF